LGHGVGEAAQVVHEQVGLLHGGEVAAWSNSDHWTMFGKPWSASRLIGRKSAAS